MESAVESWMGTTAKTCVTNMYNMYMFMNQIHLTRLRVKPACDCKTCFEHHLTSWKFKHNIHDCLVVFRCTCHQNTHAALARNVAAKLAYWVQNIQMLSIVVGRVGGFFGNRGRKKKICSELLSNSRITGWLIERQKNERQKKTKKSTNNAIVLINKRIFKTNS